MKTKSSKLTSNLLFPEIIESRGDNNPFTYLANSKELERYYNVLISLYPIHDGRLLHVTRRLKDAIDTLWRSTGSKYTVEYLKEANRLFQFFVAGNPQHKSESLRVGVARGLPIIIPAIHRQILINQKDARDYTNIVRIIFALLGCYRLIRYPGELKLETITDSTDSQGINPWELGYCISIKFKTLFDKLPIKDYSYNLLSLTTAGPNNRISLLSAPLDAIALKRSDICNGLKVLSDYFKLGTYSLLEEEWEVLKDIQDDTRLLSKLSIKEEPAGKRRVFAIVDIWTQSVLKPIHDHVFSILKLIPQDGAFDQIAPVRALIQRNKSLKTYCFDLSAATDRFPISVQVDLLSHLYNRDVALAWKQVLVNRPYYLRETGKSYTYGAGQPMGALSSWGVFSLCHHLIVQIAATRVGIRNWFDEYALLGDDIVITNTEVADMYYKIMTEELKVSINKSKSLQSDIGVMEFAKRIIGPMGDFSPVGPKNVSLILNNKLHLPSLLVDLKEKGISIDYFFVKNLFTKFKERNLFKFTWTETQAFIWSLTKPFGFVDSFGNSPRKWVKAFRKDEMSGDLDKLLHFLKEEWSLSKDKALDACKSCIDKYEGLLHIGDMFIDTRILPSLREQKLKLIEEYARLSNLTYPTIIFKTNGEHLTREYMEISFYEFPLYNEDDPVEESLIHKVLRDNPDFLSRLNVEISVLEPKTGNLISSKSFDLQRPDYAMSLILHYLMDILPPVTPVTSVFDDNNIIRRSLRHVSYRFLKKFLNWTHNV